jgi:rhodanese-related sulfurtransferase
MRTVSTEQVQAILEDRDSLLINVLDPEEFDRAHIPGSENVPFSEDDFVEHVEALADDAGTPLVIYCAGPGCDASRLASHALDRAGFTEVHHYEGGMAAWIASMGKVDGSPRSVA